MHNGITMAPSRAAHVRFHQDGWEAFYRQYTGLPCDREQFPECHARSSTAAHREAAAKRQRDTGVTPAQCCANHKAIVLKLVAYADHLRATGW